MGKGDNKKSRKTKKSDETNDSAAATKRRAKKNGAPQKEILFSKDNYIIIGVGLATVIIGFFLMSGGYNSPDEWDVNEIYSFRRITIAPIVILSGLGVVIFAIFKSSEPSELQSLEEVEEIVAE